MLQWLTNPYAIYQCFLTLQPGDAIPEELFIALYEDGGIPEWVLVERVEIEADGLQLLVEDHAPAQVEVKARLGLALLPRVGILTFPSKSVCIRANSRFRGWPWPNRMASLEQQARIANKRATAEEAHSSDQKPAVLPTHPRRRRAPAAQTPLL